MSSEEHQVICVRCPRGCEVSFHTDEAGQVSEVTGNFCKLGVAHVQSELTDPRRTLTTTVRVAGGRHALVPVWSEAPLPKDRVLEVAGLLRNKVLTAPVQCGDPVLEDVLGLGIRIVTSASVDAA
jgi:CxxC motif-containing protein